MQEKNWIRRFAKSGVNRWKQVRWNREQSRCGPQLQQQVHETIELISGPATLPIDGDGPVLVTMTRDSEHFIKPFIEHHLRIGCQWIVIVDNGSTDQTVEIAQLFDRVTVLRSTLPFGQFKTPTRHYLMRRFCENRWCLRVDADEFFDYPSVSSCALPDLIAYLDEYRYTAVVGQMLELFPQGPLLNSSTHEHAPLVVDSHCWYDVEQVERRPYGYEFYGNQTPKPTPEVYYGGIRRKAFGFNPLLTKHPLVFCNPDVLKGLGNAHSIRNARVADFSVVLRHYKFAGDFQRLIRQAIDEKGYHNASVEYQHYDQALSANPELTVWSPQARRLINPAQLLKEGFVIASERFLSAMSMAVPEPQEAVCSV